MSKNLTPPLLTALFLFLILLSGACAQNSPAVESSKTDTPTAVSTPKPDTNLSQNNGQGQSASKALVIHKPRPSPAWGKIVQFRREEINKETLYEFVLQDDQGIIRTATYHENSSGDGYWEVLVWDQP
jgi:hypothetical protein